MTAKNRKRLVVGSMYKPPNTDPSIFSTHLNQIVVKAQRTRGKIQPENIIGMDPRTKITWRWHHVPHDAPHHGASDTTHPSSTTHNIPHQHTTHPTTHPTITPTSPPPIKPPHPTTTTPTHTTTTPHLHPQRKSGALMPDISWAPPHSLLIW